ncbi:NUDIX hydrolase [Candidatus Poriferisocius sp.]|uniref:NUDIX hydrolase n=1 Tax=Candidatus Poriferisocius sp. TaxID=3101276 RepID=UPI003B52A00A
MDLNQLRAALDGRPQSTWGDTPPTGQERRSAVLVLLYPEDGEFCVLLIRRAQHLRSHSWEVAFPGGGQEDGDDTLLATAQRETREEIGLDTGQVDVIGQLDRYVTVGSRSLVHPFVGFLPHPPAGLIPDPAEVEHILLVSTAELLSDEAWREEIWPINGVDRPITFFELYGDTVWGATAAMLRQLLTIATTR